MSYHYNEPHQEVIEYYIKGENVCRDLDFQKKLGGGVSIIVEEVNSAETV